MFNSFFLAGFEGTTGYSKNRHWIDGVALTHHDRFLQDDYALVKRFGIREVRECIRWPLVDNGHEFDFATVDPIIEASRRAGLTVIYDLFHFGFPSNLDVFSDEFTRRFAEYCYRIARRVAREAEGPCYFTPVNEPSYFAWAAGEVGLFAPYLERQGHVIKVALIKAAIAGIEAIWSACPRSRIVSVDPFCRVVPARDEDSERAEHFNSSVVFESWDMLSGARLPELGGSPKHLDIVGLNYYSTNQWIVDQPGAVLPDEDPRRISLSEIVRIVWERYGREIIITETSAVGDRRPFWLVDVVKEAGVTLSQLIPLEGVCWYPILEMAEWHVPNAWTRMGLWDLDHRGETLQRIGYTPALRLLREAEEQLRNQYEFARGSVACAYL